MELKIYSIYDNKAQAFLPMFTVRTHGEAIRSFTDICNNPKTNVNKYPEDFALMEIGTFNDSTGGVDALNVPKNIGLAREFVIPDANVDPTVPRLELAKNEEETKY